MSDKFYDHIRDSIIAIFLLLLATALIALWITVVFCEDCRVSFEIGRWIGISTFAVMTGYILRRTVFRRFRLWKVVRFFAAFPRRWRANARVNRWHREFQRRGGYT